MWALISPTCDIPYVTLTSYLCYPLCRPSFPTCAIPYYRYFLPVVSLMQVFCICGTPLRFQRRDGLELDEEDFDAPSEEMIERMEERLEAAQSEQKNLFLIIFQVIWNKHRDTIGVNEWVSGASKPVSESVNHLFYSATNAIVFKLEKCFSLRIFQVLYLPVSESVNLFLLGFVSTQNFFWVARLVQNDRNMLILKMLLICIWCYFQRFIMILTEHLARCEADGQDYNTPWYKWVIERLQQVFLMVSGVEGWWFLTVGKILLNKNKTGQGSFWLCRVKSKKVHSPYPDPGVLFDNFAAPWAGLQLHHHTGVSHVHQWHWHPHSGGLPAVLCAAIMRQWALWLVFTSWDSGHSGTSQGC